MSGYNQNWRRRDRDRDSRGAGGRGSQNNSNFWNNSHYGNYQNYPQYSYSPQYAQQWSWGSSNQFQSSFNQRPSRHVTFTPGQQQQQQHGKNVQPHRLPSPGSDSSKQRSSLSLSRSKSPPDPHPGSEEARKKTLAQTTDKIKSCLRSFQNEKSDVLENLLSGEETESNTEAAKGSAVTLETSGQELQLTPSDLKVIGMVNTSGLAVEEEDSGIPVETNTFTKETLAAEASEQDLNNEACSTDLLQNGSKSAKNKNAASKEAVKFSASSSSEVSEKSNADSDQSNSRAQTACQGEATHSKDSTDKIQTDSAETLQKLKQRIIQQFLKMGKNNLKDLLNNPRSRKFEFAMNHLMKEHRKVLSRELRGLAQSRIKGQESQVQSHVAEASSLLDTDVAINLSHLPQELIEQLGNLLQLDLLDNVSEEFQPNMAVVEEESKYNVMQNIETLQVALMSEDNIKKENVESQQIDNAVDFTPQDVASETNAEEHNASMPSLQSDNETLETAQEQVATDERETVHEEGNVIKKARKPSTDWCPYIPLGKGFMNRGEFGSLFCEFPDFMEMESAESDEQEIHLKDQSEVCNEPPPTELLENVPANDIGNTKTDSNKETLEQNLIADPETTVGESKEEENLRHSELDLFEDLQVPIIDTVDKQVTAVCREPSQNEVNAVEDAQMQEVPMDVCDSSTGPESAAGIEPHDDTTKNILDLEETLARVDESVAGMGDNGNKQTESEGIEYDLSDAEMENPCDPSDVNDDVLEGLRSIVENAATAENVESASDMNENNATEANITNEDICETEAIPASMDADVSAMSVEQCSDVLPEHNVDDFVADKENQALTNYDSDVNLNPVLSGELENVVAAGKENTGQSSDLHLEDEVTELYRYNIVVKTEAPDTEVQQRNREEEPVQKMRHTTEIAVQTETSEELDSLNIEKFLHCLERSGQLSPHLTRLLKEQLSNKQVEMVEKEQVSLRTSASTVPMILIPPASQHIMRASRTPGNKGRTRIRGGLRSNSEEVRIEHQAGAQDLGSMRNAFGDIGNSSVNCAGRNLLNPEDILPLPVRREPTAISKFVFLKMLEIDKEIQKLMELKLDLYRKLQVTLEMDPSSVDGKGTASVNSRDVEESGLSKERVVSPYSQVVPPEQLRQQIHAAAITVNDPDAPENVDIRRKPLPSCSSNLVPMVMLPMDVLSHQSSQSSRQKLKTLDTSVVEAVLNSFDIPEQPLKEKEPMNTGSEETLESPSQNKHSSHVSPSEVTIASEATDKKPSVKQSASKKKTNTAKKNTGKNKSAETAVSLENSGANEEVEATKARDVRRKKPEGKTKGRNTRHKANIDSEEENEPLSGNSSLQETNNKLAENYDREVETPMKLKSRRGSENSPDKAKNQRNKKEAEENVCETSVAQYEENLQSKTTRNRRESKKAEVSTEEATELEEQENRKNHRKAVEAEQVATETEEITSKKSRGSKQRAMLAINDALTSDDSPSKNSRKRKVSLKGDNLNENEQDDESAALATRFRTRSPRKFTSEQESLQSENEINKKMRLHGGNEEPSGKRSTRTSLSESGRRNSHSEVVEETTEIKRQTGLKRKAEEALGSPEKCQRVSKIDLKEIWNMPSCFVVVHPLAEEQIRSLSGSAAEIKDNSHDDDAAAADNPVVEQEKKEKKKPAKKRQSSKASARITHNVDVKENEPEQLDLAEKQEDPLGGIPDACQPPELHSESYISAVSTPLQSPPDLMVQTVSPRTNISTQDENSISTLISDSVSVNSDGEHSFVKRNPCDVSSEKEDCDRDSLHSCDTGPEIRDGAGSRSLKHKSSKRHKKDIERLTFEAHQGPILDIKTVGRHVLAASEDGFVYCYSLKSGKFKRKYGVHDSAVTCLCVVECCVEPDVSSELEAGEQVTPELFFTGSLDKYLRYFSFKTGELVQPPVNIGSPIQCMDQNWGILFIGTKIGEVIQYNIKSSSIIGEEPLKLGREAILSLKATKEGPRNVLIIGTRNKPITIRDASSGLLLRSINNSWSHTVYSLVLNANEIYCGTKNGFIPVIQFQNGEQICKFRTGAGVVCMRIYNNLLFAGCYDGNIYVFSIQDKKLISCIPGPGKMLLCLDIVKNRIIVGSKDGNKLEAWGFPQDVRNHVKEAKHR